MKKALMKALEPVFKETITVINKVIQFLEEIAILIAIGVIIVLILLFTNPVGWMVCTLIAVKLIFF